MINESGVYVTQQKAPPKIDWGFLLTVTRHKCRELCNKSRYRIPISQGADSQLLAEQQEPPRLDKVSCPQPVEVHAARKPLPIQPDFVITSLLLSILEKLNLLTEGVEN
jgi:hypothetical protein